MLAISDALKKHGLNKENIRFELFASGQPGRAKKKAASNQTTETGTMGRVTLNGVHVRLVYVQHVAQKLLRAKWKW